jgi:Tol biopolymer transport system component
MVSSLSDTRGRLGMVSRDGRRDPLSPQARGFRFARLSPDERRIAVVVTDDGKHDVWIYDLALGTFSRLTTVETVNSVEWSADGSRVLFVAEGENGGNAVWSQPASGGTQAEKLFEHAVTTTMATMSPDGRSLLVNALREDSWALYRVGPDSSRIAHTYLAGKGNLHAPQFSPDGRWVALVSDESGRDEVYVRSFPDPSSRIPISTAGGSEPAWSRDGSRLYYRSGAALLSARVSTSPTFTLLSRDTVLSSAPFQGSGYFSGAYQPMRDGRRFLTVLPSRNDYQLVVSPNWITELRRRVAESGGRK